MLTITQLFTGFAVITGSTSVILGTTTQPNLPPTAPSTVLAERVSDPVISRAGLYFDVIVPQSITSAQDMNFVGMLMNMTPKSIELSFNSGNPLYWFEFSNTRTQEVKRCNLASVVREPIIMLSVGGKRTIKPAGGLALPCVLRGSNSQPALIPGEYEVVVIMESGDPDVSRTYWRSYKRKFIVNPQR